MAGAAFTQKLARRRQGSDRGPACDQPVSTTAQTASPAHMQAKWRPAGRAARATLQFEGAQTSILGPSRQGI